MAIHFRDASLAPLHQVTVSAPDGAFIGLVGENGGGVRQLLRLAAGHESAASGEVETSGPARYFGPLEALDFGQEPLLAIDHTLAFQDAFSRGRALSTLHRLRREGATILAASHDTDLLHQIADEVWWLHDGRLRAKGDPREVTAQYHSHIADRLRQWGAGAQNPLAPSLRRGDGRAEILSIETLDEAGRHAKIVRSGDPMAIRVTARFRHPVDNPVIGVMIRTRIGSEVYGTNTELERYPLGSPAAGEKVRVTYRFHCHLCPQEYTVTAASHDSNGVWHDWMEDAIAFHVAGDRYTAGVANLRAEVSAEKESA